MSLMVIAKKLVMFGIYWIVIFNISAAQLLQTSNNKLCRRVGHSLNTPSIQKQVCRYCCDIYVNFL